MASEGVDNKGYSGETQNRHPAENENPSIKTKEKWTCCQITFLVLGTFSTLMGVAMLAGGYQAMFDAILQNQLELTPGSTAFDMWRLTPVPLYLYFYFFNITNPDEFTNGSMPILQEVGPYCYREYHEKQNLTFYPNDTVSFYQQRWWIWDQEASGIHFEDDIITIVNTIPVSAAWSVRHKPLLMSGLNAFLNSAGEKLIVRETVRNIIFDGFEDPLLSWMANMTELLNSTDIDLPDFGFPPGLTDYDKFGWFYKRNMSFTYDGLFNMYTGHNNLDNVGKIDLWNRRNETDYFERPCNAVNGSAGEMWPPNQQKDFIYFYSSDLCMTMKLFYKEEVRDSNNVPGYRYWGINQTFSYDGVLDEQECYCVQETCAPIGLLNAESCRMGSPAFISFPHYLHADPTLLNTVEGLSPDEDKHAFFIDLIHELGTPVSVAARMQINMHIMPYKPNILGHGGIDILNNVTEVYLPLLWFEEIAGLPKDLAREMNMLLFIMHTPTMTIIWSLMIGLGISSVFFGLYRHYRPPVCSN